MTSEELDRAIEFLTQQSANFWAGMEETKLRDEREDAALRRSIQDLKEQTARFEAWASELVAIQSRRLDQNEQKLIQNELGLEEQRRTNNEMIRLLTFIIDRLFPSQN